jgi:sensor histidine kinase YesM
VIAVSTDSLAPRERDHGRGFALGFLAFQLLAWGGYVAVGLLMILPQTGPRPSVIGGYALFFLYTLALTYGLRALIRRRDWLSLSPIAAISRLFIAALVLGTIQCVLIVGIGFIWTGAPLSSYPKAFFPSIWMSTTAASLAWTAVYTGAASLLRARRMHQNAIRMELDMREARLKALEAQIGPHFLFNCLNNLRGLIVENPAVAQDIVTRLANILRHNLSRTDHPTEALREQVEFTTDYLALEQVRFEERLRTRFEISPDTLAIETPAMLLQTLVENAIKHGIAHLPEGGEIVITTHLDTLGTLSIAVENTGKLAPSPRGSTRVGVHNLRERLRVLHGPAAKLELTETPHGTVRAEVNIPRAISLLSTPKPSTL